MVRKKPRKPPSTFRPQAEHIWTALSLSFSTSPVLVDTVQFLGTLSSFEEWNRSSYLPG